MFSMNCDMCGKETELYRAVIEGSQLTVCAGCGKYGKVLGRVQQPVPEKKKKKIEAAKEPAEEVIQSVVPDFGQILKRKRESLGLNQADFAKRIAEKESILHQMETGAMKPTIERAKELERVLGAKLVEEIR